MTTELISTRKTDNGLFAITFLINSSYYKTFRISGYSRRNSIAIARTMASTDANKDAQFTNQP